jgi:hypothetical protein
MKTNIKTNNESETLLKEAAALYIEKEGLRLLEEYNAANSSAPNFNASKMLKIKRQARFRQLKRVTLIAAPVAACLIFAVFLTRLAFYNPAAETPLPPQTVGAAQEPPPAAEPHNTPSAAPPAETGEPPVKRAEIAFLSDKLPEGCKLTKTDYDKEKTLYYVRNKRSNDILLVVEPPEGELETDEKFTRKNINGTDAYILAKRDYNVLLAQTGDIRYTFSCRYDARDLVEIAYTIF